MRRAIIIGGGVGPMAGVDLHRLLIESTPTGGRDQDHLSVIHLSCSAHIPDRTAALLSGTPELPAQAMAEVVLSGIASARTLGYRSVVAVPCNTFHASSIWEPFKRYVNEQEQDVLYVHLIDQTVEHIIDSGGIQKVGIISTTGTRQFGIYSSPLEHAGLEVLHPHDQQRVHQAIYDPRWGIKACSPVSEQAVAIVTETIGELIDRGADSVILGCTELPLAYTGHEYGGIGLINPVEVAARALIRIALETDH